MAAYGQEYMITPNLDRLARESVIFASAYAQFSVCAPSRNSFMSGRTPDVTRVWNFIQHFRQPNLSEIRPEFNRDWVSLPQYFKNQGFLTLGSGKIFHWEPDTQSGTPPSNDYPTSWSTELPYVAAEDDGCGDGTTFLFCPDPVHSDRYSDEYDDYKMTMAAIEHIRYAAEDSRPFFIGLGTYRPHMRAHLPSSVTDLYPYESISIAKHGPPKRGLPPYSFKSQVDEGSAVASLPAYVVGNESDTDGDVEFTAPSLHKPDTFPVYFQQMFRQGYYSGVTLVDSYIGLVLDTLDDLSLADTTIVVFVSDHGYLLGEHAEWAKQSLFDTALRIPMLIRTPATRAASRPTAPQRVAHGIVELNDLYRTLAELAGLPAPAASVEGKSFAALVTAENGAQPFRKFALAQYPRCLTNGTQLDLYHNNTCEGVLPENFTYMGYTVRTRDWRYTAWFSWDGERCVPKWDEVDGRELYDHRLRAGSCLEPNDFDCFENENLESLPEYTGVVAELHAELVAAAKYGDHGGAAWELGCPGIPSANGHARREL